MTVINDVVIDVTKIIILNYQFLNLYFLKLYDENKDFPKINRTFLRNITSIITYKKDGRGITVAKDSVGVISDLKKFYNNNFINKCIDKADIMCCTKLSRILEYEYITMITCIENNIKEHFCEYIKNRIMKICRNMS